MPPSIGWNGSPDPNGELVSRTEHGDASVEKFAPNGGILTAVIGGLIVLSFVVVWVFDMDAVPLWIPAIALFVGVVLYASTVRPRVLVDQHELVLRNMVSTIYIPLAAVEEVAVQQMMAVRAGGKRYVCAGVGRSLRASLRGSAAMRAREQVGGLRGELAAVREPGMNYADFVELRIQELVNEDRVRRGVKRYSPEADELAGKVRREWARPEIAALAATAVFVVVALLVG
jgi:hypothetical protein